MFLIDTHSHIYLDNFDNDRQIAIDRALQENVKIILLPNIDSGSIKKVLDLASKNEGICYPMLGLHPTSIKENYKEELDIIEKAISLHKIIAVGEIGLDLYWDKSFINQQIEALEKQINIANNHKLPIVLHVRDAFNHIFDVIESNKNDEKGVFHCFSGKLDDAIRAVDLGYYLGIGGPVSYKNSILPSIIKEIGINKIILETDSPYLSPMPYRGKRNEPANIKIIANTISEILGITIDEVARITTNNALKLFDIENKQA
ncbi:MAG: hypothetical protein A2X12_11830 [Bacteroidetes bacterium GWE2_29_8]|nr:MAG: hypothetical protein A2X12_11830 [Bacteroidetes bacterium GWE2_29_8]OFY20764.1 MAG: hypothetical protein A2X02_09735 [Bacteroidetes bacterium GWF2_29_10]